MGILKDNYFLGVPTSLDMGDKLALYCLIIQLHHKIQAKKPNVKYSDVIKLCIQDKTPDLQDYVEKLSEICEWLAYDCKIIPDMNLTGQQMVDKINELVKNTIPF